MVLVGPFQLTMCCDPTAMGKRTECNIKGGNSDACSLKCLIDMENRGQNDSTPRVLSPFPQPHRTCREPPGPPQHRPAPPHVASPAPTRPRPAADTPRAAPPARPPLLPAAAARESPPPDPSSSRWKGKYEAEPPPRFVDTGEDAASGARSQERGTGSRRRGGVSRPPCRPASRPPPSAGHGLPGPALSAARPAVRAGGPGTERGDVRPVRQPDAVPVPGPAAAR